MWRPKWRLRKRSHGKHWCKQWKCKLERIRWALSCHTHVIVHALKMDPNIQQVQLVLLGFLVSLFPLFLPLFLGARLGGIFLSWPFNYTIHVYAGHVTVTRYCWIIKNNVYRFWWIWIVVNTASSRCKRSPQTPYWLEALSCKHCLNPLLQPFEFFSALCW